MTREEAIERLEFHKKVWLMVGGLDLCEVLDMAIAALREQVGSFQNGNDHNTVKDWPSYMDLPRKQEERSKGCSWCKSLENGDYALGDMIARGYVEHTFCGDGRPYRQKAKFCPMCGRRLENV